MSEAIQSLQNIKKKKQKIKTYIINLSTPTKHDTLKAIKER